MLMSLMGLRSQQQLTMTREMELDMTSIDYGRLSMRLGNDSVSVGC